MITCQDPLRLAIKRARHDPVSPIGRMGAGSFLNEN